MERKLSSRHITMIAIGGAIGTGLFMGSGLVIKEVGSYGGVGVYLLIGLIIYLFMNSIGELASFYPVSGSYSSYASRFINKSLGFTLGWLFWFVWIMVTGIDIITFSKLLQFWDVFQQIPSLLICFALLGALFVVNLLSVKLYGEIEFCLSLVKVIVIFAFILTGLYILFVGINDSPVGLSTFVANGEKIKEVGLLGVISVLTTALFSFGGVEAIAITAGESEEPHKTMPKAIWSVFWRILIFYVLTMFIISAIIPVSDARLSDVNNVISSPFTIVFQYSGLATAAIAVNIVLLTAVLSAGNSGMYAVSRQLYSLSKEGLAPSALSKLSKRSSPVMALLVSSIIIGATFLLEYYFKDGYYTIMSMVGIIGGMVWVVGLISHIRLIKAIKIQGKTTKKVLPFNSITGVKGSWICVCLLTMILSFQLILDVYQKEYYKLLFHTLVPIIALLMYFIHKFKHKTKTISYQDIDISKYEL